MKTCTRSQTSFRPRVSRFTSLGLACLLIVSVLAPARAANTFTTTAALANGRQSHTATLLHNGKVLVAGGRTNFTPVAVAELYDPASGVWTNTGALDTARYAHTATLLPNGKVLVASGYNSSGNTVASAEL